MIDARSAVSGSLEDSAHAGVVTWSTGRGVAAVNIGDTDFNGADNLVIGAWTFGLWDIGDLEGFVDEAGATNFLTYNTEGEWITGVAPVGDFDGDARADIALLAADWPQFSEQGQLALVPGEQFGGSLDLTTMRFAARGARRGRASGTAWRRSAISMKTASPTSPWRPPERPTAAQARALYTCCRCPDWVARRPRRRREARPEPARCRGAAALRESRHPAPSRGHRDPTTT